MNNSPQKKPKKIAIIGSGISGMGMAYALHHAGHNISVFEANNYIGGHSRTIEIPEGNQNIPTDTGFIVFNERNYPNLVGLFTHLGVKTEKSDMSFGVDIAHKGQKSWLEYSSSNMILPKNLLRRKYWKMLFDILRFNKSAPKIIQKNPDLTIKELLTQMSLGQWFKDYYLQAMGAAIWSTPTQKIEDFPARSFITFFQNHGLLTIFNQPQWYTVSGGSREYIKKLTADFQNKIHLNKAVTNVTQNSREVELTINQDKKVIFDEVVFACHADTALKILEQPSTQQKDILGSFSYQNNHVVTHNDIRFMPLNKSCWASWVYLADSKNQSTNVSLTYWMNNLQNLKTKQPVLITLNPQTMPSDEKIFDEHHFTHPIFDTTAIKAQNEIKNIQGIDNMWFIGAYQRYGFHEDGLLSAVRALKKMGENIPWH